MTTAQGATGDSTDNPETGTATGHSEDDDAARLLAEATGQGSTPDDDDDDDTDWRAEVQRLRAQLENTKRIARKQEGRAKQNAAAVQHAQTVEQQLEEMRRQLAERDVADMEQRGRLAMADVVTRLVDTGIKKEDVMPFLSMVDPVTSLIKDGEPHEEAIKELVTALQRLVGRVRPDPDQGRRSGKLPTDMNTLIRQRAGVIAP